jgi:membrane-associated phospholipid phosphatase
VTAASDEHGPQLGPDRSLLTPAARPWAAGLLAGCALLVAVFGVLFAHHTQAGRLDHAVDAPVISWLSGDPELALRMAYPGSVIPAALLSAVIAVSCLIAGRRSGAVLAAVAVPVSVELDELLLKPLFHRTYLGVLSYPSGHTTAISALAVTLTVLLLVPPHSGRPWALRAAAPAAAWLLTMVVAVGVVGLRWHYFTDTIGGAAVSTGTVCALALILDLPAMSAWLAGIGRGRPGGGKVRAINDGTR